jgi:hypothetical protein
VRRVQEISWDRVERVDLTRLQKPDCAGRLFGQPGGKDAASRATADDQNVNLMLLPADLRDLSSPRWFGAMSPGAV